MSAESRNILRAPIRAIVTVPELRRFSRDTLVLLITFGVFNGSNYVFHVIVSRLLGPSDYGALAALLAVVMVVSVPLGVLQTALAQRTASLVARGRGAEVAPLAAGLTKTLIPVGGLSFAGLAASAPALALFLHLDVLSAVLLAPYVLVSLIASVPMGVLHGEQRFIAISGLMLVGVAFRLVLGVGLVLAGAGVAGAVLATAIAPAAVLALGFWLVRIGPRALREARRALAHLRGDFAGPLLALTFFWLLAEVDIALARHFLSADEAGHYSAAGVLARALLFFPAAVSIVAFPRFVAAREHGEGHTRWLRRSLIAVGVLVVAALPLLMVLRGEFVVVAFGSSFLPAAPVLLLLAPAMALLALSSVLVYFHIAMASRAYLILIGGSLVETALIGRWHETPEQIAASVFVTSTTVTLLLLQTALSICRWRPALERNDEPQPVLAGPPSLELTVVIPCHNAGAGLAGVLQSLIRQLDLQHVTSYEIIVVNDGSTDNTVAVAERFSGAHTRVIDSGARSGKGGALKVGLREARGTYVAFVDADGDIASEGLGPFLALMKLYDPDIVLGSKRHPLSVVNYPPLRRILSWVYLRSVRLLFRLRVNDTLTGMRLIRRDVLASVLPRLIEKRYAFDIEFLVVARTLGYKRVFEAPVRVDYKFASQINLRALFLVLIDTLAIFYRHYILDTYRQAGQRAHAGSIVATAIPIAGAGDEPILSGFSRPATARRP